MTIWIPERDSLTKPLHSSLVSQMKEAIADGRLPVGTQLPPHRTLAYKLGISVHTISKAYEELRRQGLIDGHVGRGTYVLDPTLFSRQPYLMERGDNGMIDLSIARPLYDSIHVKRMTKSLNSLSDSLSHDVYLACRPNVGLTEHRLKGVEWLKQCGLETSVESVVMTNGVSHGMATALSAVARPGEVVVTEKVGHHLIISLAAHLGLRLQGLETDQEGVLPEALEAACQQQKVKVFFTVPTIANPTVSMMSEERRRKLIEVARRHDVRIIEDDAWGPLVENRPPPIAALAPERTIYLTSFTKCTMPGIRAGYLVAPESMIPTITARLVVFSWMATPLIAEIASRWVTDGTAMELVEWQRAALKQRHEIVEEVFDDDHWVGHEHALHFWLNLPDHWNLANFVEHARAIGVAVAPSQPFLTPGTPPINAVRIAVGGTYDSKRFRHGLNLLKGLLKQPAEPLLHYL